MEELRLTDLKRIEGGNRPPRPLIIGIIIPRIDRERIVVKPNN